MYGYLTPQLAPIFSEATRNDSIHLPKYRGRSFYDGPTNAADYFLRKETQVMDNGFFQLVHTEPGVHRNSVTFSGGGTGHRIDLAANRTLDLASCDKPKKPGVIYDLLNHETYELP